MYLVMLCDLRDRFLAPDRLQGYLCLELGRMIRSRPADGLPPGFAWTEIHLYPCPRKRRQLSSAGSSVPKTSMLGPVLGQLLVTPEMVFPQKIVVRALHLLIR